MVFLPYLRALADRGHDVHVISNFDSSHPNITDISIVGSMPMSNNNVTFPGTAGQFGIVGTMADMFELYDKAKSTEGVFEVPAVRRLLDDRTASFDLVIAEHFNSELPLGFVAKYRVPFVLLSSCPLTPWTTSLVGQSQHTAYRPSVFSGLPERMDLAQRLTNTAVAIVSTAIFRLMHRPWSQRTVKKHLGLDVSLDELASNVSLVLVNTHWSLNGVSPTMPAVKETGGMHVMPPKHLPTVSIFLYFIILYAITINRLVYRSNVKCFYLNHSYNMFNVFKYPHTNIILNIFDISIIILC